MRPFVMLAVLLVLLAACTVAAKESTVSSDTQPEATPGQQTAGGAARGSSPSAGPSTTAARIRPEEIIQIIPRDAIPSIDKPQFLTAEEASKQYADDEQVMGVDVAGERRAYPVRLLATREIVNDVVGGVPVAVTF